MASFLPASEDDLLAELARAVRDGTGNPATLTTAADLRGFLSTLIREVVNRPVASTPTAGETTAGGLGLLAPNGQGYRFTVDDNGGLHLAPADAQALPATLLTAPNGLSYRLTVADDGTLGTVPSDGVVDADAAAFIAAAGLENPAQQQAVHELVRALKETNVWPRLRACYPMVGGTARAHALNLKDPRDADEAFRLTFFNNPRHAELGVGWNGVNQYADTHFVAATQLALDSSHLAYYATTAADDTGRVEVEIGTKDSAYLSLLMYYRGGMAYDAVRRSVYSTEIRTSLGFGLGTQETATASRLYRDGHVLDLSTSTGQSASYPTASVLLGSRQEGYYSQKTCGFASVGEGLSHAECVAYAEAVAAFQRALGREIDADTSLFCQAAGLREPAQIRAVAELVSALKAAGVWGRLRACYPMVGGTEQAHALNLKDPRDADEAYRLTFYNGPRHSGLGIEWDGHSQYADSHFVPSSQLDPQSCHLAYYVQRDDTPPTDSTMQVEMGCDDGNYYLGLLTLFQQTSTNFDCSYATNGAAPGQAVGSAVVAQGFVLGSRERANAASVYRDGRLLGTGALPNPSYPQGPGVHIGRRSDGLYSHKVCAFASVGDGLTTDEARAYSAAVAAFQRALGRDAALDVDAATFAAAANLREPTQVQAVDTLVRALKQAGIWDRLDACYPMVGSTEQAHRLNLKDPRDLDAAFRLTFYEGPTHSARGVEWNGSGYADTHLYPAFQLSAKAHHLGYYAVSDEESQGAHIEIGSGGNGLTLSLFAQWQSAGGGGRFETGGQVLDSEPLTTGLGFSLMYRTDDTSGALYRDGRRLATNDTLGAAPLPNVPLLLARRQDGYNSHKTCGFASIGNSLTPTQALAYSAAVAAFEQALNRAVV